MGGPSADVPCPSHTLPRRPGLHPPSYSPRSPGHLTQPPKNPRGAGGQWGWTRSHCDKHLGVENHQKSLQRIAEKCSPPLPPPPGRPEERTPWAGSALWMRCPARWHPSGLPPTDRSPAHQGHHMPVPMQRVNHNIHPGASTTKFTTRNPIAPRLVTGRGWAAKSCSPSAATPRRLQQLQHKSNSSNAAAQRLQQHGNTGHQPTAWWNKPNNLQ